MELVLMEVGKKQGYIFKSNKLKENIGASMIIKYITEELPRKELDKFYGKERLGGGGKGLYSFNSEEDAKGFIREISRKVIEEYPGVQLYFVRKEVSLENHNIAKEIEDLYILLGKKKSRKIGDIGQVSLGIEKICDSTGLPGKTYNESRIVSDEIESKLKFYKENERENLFRERIEFPKKIDELVESEKSYVAIIHIDGNSMGNKFTKLAQSYKKKIDKDKRYNTDYLEELKSLSEDINNKYLNAFNKVIEQSIVEEKSTIRPIVIAGDDVTFIAKAKDAISLAKLFIDNIVEESVIIDGEKINLNASAGIAFVKSHYPFDRGYDLAEELTGNCKHMIKINNIDSSAIDWHIVQGEESGSIVNIRKEKYVTDSLKLTMKPLYINNDSQWNSYELFKDSMDILKSSGVPRSKLKALRGEWAKGEGMARNYINYYGLEDYFNSVNHQATNMGIIKNTAVFFDAIELMDLVEEI